MHSVEDILTALGREPPGQILMINLLRSLDAGVVKRRPVRDVLERFAGVLANDALPLPKNAVLAQRLGCFFTVANAWVDSTVPQLDFYAGGKEFALSRVVEYERFYRMLNSSDVPDRHLPVPRAPWASGGGEIAHADIDRVARYINGTAWRDEMESRGLAIRIPCAWLTPRPQLDKRLHASDSRLADHYRDLIGLPHLRAGHHLIRFDFTLIQGHPPERCKYRRPHGAGNGGTRFRFHDAGAGPGCGWGRSVDLRRVRRHHASNIEGVPELVMGEFAPPLATVSAHYIGCVRRGPEREDAFFIAALSGNGNVANLAATLFDKVMS